MEFLKKFFNDESVVVGLCKFKNMKTQYCQTSIEKTTAQAHFFTKTAYKTDFSKNVLLM